MNARIDIPKEEIAAFCQRNHIRRMALFGSVLRDDFTPESDVDVLVEFEPDARIGYIGLAGLEIELDKILGRKADLHTFEGIERSRNWLLREKILSSVEAVYERT
ncbi:MAG: nucleotidyltransferase family protein [Gemmatimonadetes bacterium]|nr:nucleotidyltransferase family protein [Gemmatimonadota bacterium]MYC72140.1 nucleotidyltransferase family protein [Gemmatimonadota bacterium]MYI62663.1 nucleotidyltransferase family protein [Gemmatimonadota bacterium]